MSDRDRASSERTARFGDHVVAFDPATSTGRVAAPTPCVVTGLADLRRDPVLRPAGGPPSRPFSGDLGPGGALLVAAALAPEPSAAQAWAAWCRQTDLAAVDDRSRSVLATIAARFGDLGAAEARRDDLDLDRYRARTWLRSQLLLHAGERLASALARAGIRPVALKGVAVLHHGALALDQRPMNDVDLLVPTARLGDALAHAAAAGLRAEAGAPDGSDPVSVGRWACDLHAVGLDDGAGTSVDLHWHLLAADTRGRADDRIHERAVGVAGQPWLVTSREDTLLHVVVHGVGWTRRPGPRWVLDAAAIIGDGGIDWEVVLDEAGRRRLGSVLSTGLDVLSRAGLEVPAPVSTKARRRAGVVERMELSSRTSRTATIAAVASDRRRRGIAGPAAPPPTLPPGVSHPATGPGAVPWLRAGWGASHPWGTWSRSVAPVIEFRLGEPSVDPLRVALHVVPLVGPARPAVRVLAFAGVRPVGRWRLSDEGTVEVVLGRRRGRRRRGVRLRLVALWPCSPTRAGIDASIDHRPLGLRVVGLRWSAG